MAQSKCKKVGSKLVCGMLRAGGSVPKSGVYRLHKGEKVFTPSQMKQMKMGHSPHKTKTKKKVMQTITVHKKKAGGKKKHKCAKCRHNK